MAGYGPGKGVMPYGQFEAQPFAGSQPGEVASLTWPEPDAANLFLGVLCVLIEQSERAVYKQIELRMTQGRKGFTRTRLPYRQKNPACPAKFQRRRVHPVNPVKPVGIGLTADPHRNGVPVCPHIACRPM